MRRVNARPWLGEAGVVVVAAGRQDMILSSRAPIGSSGYADQPPRLLGFQQPRGQAMASLGKAPAKILCSALNASTTNGLPAR